MPMAQFTFGKLLLPQSFLFLILLTTSSTLDTINPSQPLRDGDTLVSPDQTFELGFFSLTADSKFRYLGLWYKKISNQTYVWVANREAPFSNNFGALNITKHGDLVLVNSTGHIFWSSNASRTAKDPVAQLLDSGNFVVRDANGGNYTENFLWQSFDHPVDTLLPGMKLGGNLVTGVNWFLSSWKSTDDPAEGQFSLCIGLKGYPQMFLRKGTNIQYRAGSWNGLSLTGAPTLEYNPIFTYQFNGNEVYFLYHELQNNSVIARFSLNPSGQAQRFTWDGGRHDWIVSDSGRQDECENYAWCDANSICDTSKPQVCACLDGFIPKSPRNWNEQIWSDGCVRRTLLDCNNKDQFQKLTGIKLPDTSSSWYNSSIDLKACESWCRTNCSCTAYANLDMREGGSGCLLWFNDLNDMRALLGGGQDLYVRMAASEIAKLENERLSSKKKVGIVVGAILAIFSMLMIFCLWKRNLRKQGTTNKILETDKQKEGKEEEMELPLFSLTTIADATNNFASSNKLGEGGFGSVYKGTLKEGQEIAVKRLSQGSSQGLSEFKNEVILIAKLQHRNLVKLLGCCIQEAEKMLIYEYMPNKSLNSFIFDETRSKILDWHRRMQIINGIARGLLYLHQDSRLRIIHRDLKASNILLDKDMNPKISDFGLARMFGGDQIEANTKRVVGTYGYMSPEYMVDGLFSVKSDVFSFGVLVLEIISGKKNWGFCHSEHDLNLLGHAWMLWTKETPLELIDECLTDSYTPSEVVRCMNIALLCVQKGAEDRPNMSSAVVMLSSENPLPQPKQPGFFMERVPPKPDNSSTYSANDATITLLDPR